MLTAITAIKIRSPRREPQTRTSSPLVSTNTSPSSKKRDLLNHATPKALDEILTGCFQSSPPRSAAHGWQRNRAPLHERPLFSPPRTFQTFFHPASVANGNGCVAAHCMTRLWSPHHVPATRATSILRRLMLSVPIQRDPRFILCADLMCLVCTVGNGERTAAVPDAHHITSIIHARYGRLRTDWNMHIRVIHVVEYNPAAHGVGALQLFYGFFVRDIHNHTLHFRPLACC